MFMTPGFNRMAIAVAVMCATVGVTTAAQTTSTMKEEKAFQVISVDGNTLVVKLPEGTKEITVPDDFRFIINGQPMSVQQLKPGMKGTATITTTTTETPVTVTEVKNATVMQSSGSTILLRTAEGYKSFTQGEIDKRGVKIMKNGKPAQLSDFRAGDKLSATIITSMPPKVLTQKEVAGTLAAAAPAAAPTSAAAPAKAPASSGALASSRTATGAATPSGSGRTLPKTASSWPLFGLVSLLALGMGLGLTFRRLFVS
jgi:hypothetical protein